MDLTTQIGHNMHLSWTRQCKMRQRSYSTLSEPEVGKEMHRDIGDSSGPRTLLGDHSYKSWAHSFGS